MLTFNQFLKEELIVEEHGGEIADASGKAFELELARELHPNKQYPEHHNDESGRSPSAVAQQLRGTLGHEAYNRIQQHAKSAAAEHIKNTGHKITKVWWTSLDGQVSKTTGKNEAGHPADLVYQHEVATKGSKKPTNQFHSISAKYGSKPGTRSPGMKDLATMSGMNHEHLEKLIQQHKDAVGDIMKPHVTSNTDKGRHAEFKEIKAGKKGAKAAAAATEAAATSLAHRKGIAGHLAEHFSNLAERDHGAMTEVVRKLTASRATQTPMSKVHHDTKTNKTNISNPSEEFDRAMSNVHHFSVEHKGMYIHIHAHDHNGKKHSIAKISIKNKSSSPFTNMVGSVSLGKGLKTLSQ